MPFHSRVRDAGCDEGRDLWTYVGQTAGRGKKSAVHHQIIPIKDIWLYPLRKDFASVLCR